MSGVADGHLAGAEADQLEGDPVWVGQHREHVPPPRHDLQQSQLNPLFIFHLSDLNRVEEDVLHLPALIKHKEYNMFFNLCVGSMCPK